MRKKGHIITWEVKGGKICEGNGPISLQRGVTASALAKSIVCQPSHLVHPTDPQI